MIDGGALGRERSATRGISHDHVMEPSGLGTSRGPLITAGRGQCHPCFYRRRGTMGSAMRGPLLDFVPLADSNLCPSL